MANQDDRGARKPAPVGARATVVSILAVAAVVGLVFAVNGSGGRGGGGGNGVPTPPSTQNATPSPSPTEADPPDESEDIIALFDPDAHFEVPRVPKPRYLSPQIIGPFGTTVTRIAGDPGTRIPEVGGRWSRDARHHSVKDQPWNSDGSLIALQNIASKGGNPSDLLLDGETYRPVAGRCRNYEPDEDRWHPSTAHANERIAVMGGELSWFDVVACTKTRTWDLPFRVAAFGLGEGNVSLDARYVVLGDETRMFVVDMDPRPPYRSYPYRRIGPVVSLDDCGLKLCEATWVSVSPSGKYAVVHYSGEPIRVFDIDPATLALTPRPMPRAYANCPGDPEKGFIYSLGHSDMTLNPYDDGAEVIVGQEHCGNHGRRIAGRRVGWVVMARLSDGKITSLTRGADEAYPHHISTRNTERPGWAYVSYYGERPGRRFNDEIIAVRLDGSYTVQRFAHTRSRTGGCYRCEKHAVPAPDGRRVIFASNWMLRCVSKCGSRSVIQAYVVDARPRGSGPAGP